MKTVVVEDAVLTALASDPAAVAELPRLLGPVAAFLREPKPACSKCGAGNAAHLQRRRALYARVRQAVAALSPADRAALKGRLGADTLVVHAIGPTGRVTPLNF